MHDHKAGKSRFILGFGLVALLGGAGFVAGLLPRIHQRSEVAADTQELAVTTVNVARPMPGKAGAPLSMSGELKALSEAPIYARASGYVRRWLVDIGAHVQAGDLLAELDTPEIDRELAQMQAQLKQAEAARQLAETTAKRWTQLLSGKTVSAQEAEEKTADVALKQAAVDAARANVQRLQEMLGFAKITAPFAGTITSRRLDVGQLVSAGSGQELFRLAQTEKLRVFIRVPQSHARAVTVDQQAEVTIPELPGRKFEARIVRTAGAMDAASRTLLTELEVDNAKGELLAGGYAQVRLPNANAEAALTLPSNTLLFRAQGLQVAIVGGNNRVTLQQVTLGRDFGQSVEILSGVKPTDEVVINPPDSLVDGAEVRAVRPEQKPS